MYLCVCLQWLIPENRRIQGNGLGLTIAQTLAQQLGGEIVLESEPNVKTTFTVKLHKCFF